MSENTEKILKIIFDLIPEATSVIFVDYYSPSTGNSNPGNKSFFQIGQITFKSPSDRQMVKQRLDPKNQYLDLWFCWGQFLGLHDRKKGIDIDESDLEVQFFREDYIST